MAIQSLAIIIFVLAVFLVAGVPISYAIGISALAAILQMVSLDVSVLTAAQRTFVGMSKFSLTAIPFFVLAGNLITGSFKLGFELQPIAHSSQLWNLLGMVLVGWGSVLLGGCPLRQLILAGEGNGDSAVTVFGMIVGAAFAHNFGLAGNADAMNEAKEIVVGGISNNGKAAVCLGILIMLGVSLWNMPKAVSAPVEAAK